MREALVTIGTIIALLAGVAIVFAALYVRDTREAQRDARVRALIGAAICTPEDGIK